jgi:hypothetical protein
MHEMQPKLQQVIELLLQMKGHPLPQQHREKQSPLTQQLQPSQ